MHIHVLRRALVGTLLVAVSAVAPSVASARTHGLSKAQKLQLRQLVAHSVSAQPQVLWGRQRTLAAQASQADVLTNDLINHGGDILRHPRAYVIFWGPEWAANAAVTAGAQTYHLDDARRYITDFFSGIGGSPWNDVAAQYCQNVPIGTTDCTGIPGAEHINNDPSELAGTWVDSSAVPNPIVTSGLAENAVAQDPIATEAEKATVHFGYDPDAVYLVFTPPGLTATAYGSVYCAYHSQASTLARSRTVQYAFMPYVPEQGAGCGAGTANKTNDAYGHDYFDAYSIDGGHEYSEAETDPGNFFSFQDGWNDDQTSENGDKCAYINLHNITLTMPDQTQQYFAVQPTWSNHDFDTGNADAGCAG